MKESVLRFSIWATLLVLGAAVPASSDPVGPFTLYETATLGPTGQRFGSAVNADQFVGARFQVTAPTVTSSVGGHFVGGRPGDIFGALVSLSGPTDFPDSFDLSTADLVGVGRIRMGRNWPLSYLPSREFSAPLRAPLTPGWYALVFGAGLFGTSGDAALVFTDMRVGRTSEFFGDLVNRRWSFIEFGQGGRMFATAAPVPEPATLLLLGGGLAALARRRLRALTAR